MLPTLVGIAHITVHEPDGRARASVVLERATKAIVVGSTLLAVVFEAHHAGREHWFVPQLAFFIGLAAYSIARKYPEPAAGVVLAASYLAPVVLLLTVGSRYWNISLWIAAFVGTVAPTTSLRWQYPARLRFPLIAWALAIALTWPLVALRLLDWTPSILWTYPPTRNILVHAIPAAIWVSHTALVHLLGLLWIDWLFGRFTHARTDRFERLVIAPMLVSATLAALLSVYQAFVDLRFLSTGYWFELGRASGALIDANASGALAALWVGISLCLVVRVRTRLTTAFVGLSSLLLLTATWSSGSRTATLCALVSLIAPALLLVALSVHRRRLLLIAGIAVALLVATWAGLAPSVSGPLKRVPELLPSLSGPDVRNAAWQLWARAGYGTAAMAMIGDEPLQGVGIGAFHMLVADYVNTLSQVTVPSDNAQNWFRHHFAELGVLGSVGWIWWSGILVTALFRARRVAGESRTMSWAVAFTLAGFGLASLLGMPSQNLVVALTFWTFAFWLFLASDQPLDRTFRKAEPSWTLTGPLLLALLFASATAFAGWRDLRGPFIAKRFNYLYEYGVYESMDGPTGRTQTTAHAVSVMNAPTSLLKLTAWVEHPDADERPVRVEVWIDRQRIIQGRFPRNVPLTRLVQVPGDNKRFVIETRVDRVFSSSETSRPEVGLSLAWEFESQPAEVR